MFLLDFMQCLDRRLTYSFIFLQMTLDIRVPAEFNFDSNLFIILFIILFKKKWKFFLFYFLNIIFAHNIFFIILL